jgi:HTH-type transcriptional regulator/antitoxin HigA
MRMFAIMGSMEFNNKTYRSPGQLLVDLLATRNWTRRSLALVLAMDETGVSKMVADKRDIDAPMALMLEDTFGVDADVFLTLQKELDLARARLLATPDPSRATRASLYADLPISEMIKRGWITAGSVKDTKTVEEELVRFFGVDRVDDIEILPHAAKKSMANRDATPAQVAWLYRVKKIASEMLTCAYSPSAVRFSLSRLRTLMATQEGIAKVPRVLAECGIRFVLVEALTSSKIDGVCFWLSESSPVIGMSLRFDRIDNFWFVLRHELEHVLQGHGKAGAMLDADLEKERAGTGPNVAEEERIANEAAQAFCVPAADLDAFIARKAPFFSDKDLIGFSRMLKVHPGVLAGQLQRKTNRYDRFRDHLVNVREIISPNAIKDGWGDIAPVEQ